MMPVGSDTASTRGPPHALVSKTMAPFGVSLHRCGYTMARLALAIIHVVCAMLLTVITLLYAFPRLHAFTAELCAAYLPCLTERHDASIAFFYALLTISHAFAVIRLLPTPTAERRTTTASLSRWVSGRANAAHVALCSLQRSRTPSSSRCWIVLFDRWQLLVGRQGLFGVEYPGFDAGYTVRKCAQLVLQSRQAYYASLQMSRDWLNHIYVVSIVVNCWATPTLLLLPVASTASVASRRCAALCLDALLDVVAMVVIPCVLLASSARSFDFEAFDFHYDAWYDAMWFVNMMRELQLLVVQSWFDLAYRVVFGVNLLLCLDTIKSLLISPSLPRVRVQPKSALPASVERDAEAMTASSPSRWKRVVSIVLVLWGLAITVVHVRAFRFSYPSTCSMFVRPWFQSKPACALLVIDCINERIRGRAHELDARLQPLDHVTLSYFVVQRCGFVEMPPALQSLNNLIGIEITKCVLASWPADAALTAQHHAKMLSVTIVQSNLTEIPPGLRSTDFPPKLDDIEICDSNLTALPADIDAAWGDTYYVFVERSQLSAFPEALTRMKIAQLSLSGNNISNIPREFLCGRDIDELHVSSNPMAALPREDELLGCLPRIGRLGIVDTRVATLPEWTNGSVAVVQAFGSPLCLENSSTSANAVPRVDCNELFPLQYPLYLVPSD